mmetsp:Transcript_8021/g.25291  ORF Transcript_8021/g.25291 Transcript_8021/m.25291 type:complete len:84 (+) Transcript_8021:353-604(+)
MWSKCATVGLRRESAKRTGSTCSRTVAAVRRSNSSSSSATIFLFLSLSRAFRSLLPTTADDGIDRVSLGRRALRKRSLTTRIF